MGLIEKTQVAIAQDELAQEYGTVVEIGPLAWMDEKLDGVKLPRCKVGDHVMIHRFTGQYFTGDDQAKYRVVTDKDILCLADQVKGDNDE